MTRTRTARPLAALLLAALALPGAASAIDTGWPTDAPAWPAIVELHDAVIELGPDDWIEAGHVVQVASPLDPDGPPLHLLSEGVLVVADGQAITTASASWDPASGVLESAAFDVDLSNVRDPMPRPPGPQPPPGRVRITCEAGEMIYNGRNIGRVDRDRAVPVGPFTTWCVGDRVSARWVPRVEP